MSQQPPQRQLSPEESEYLKSKTRSNNLFTWFTGLSVGMMVLVAGAFAGGLCAVLACCIFALYTINQTGPR